MRARDQGDLDAPILSQSRKAQNCYLAMAAMRPPRQQSGHAADSHSPSGAFTFRPCPRTSPKSSRGSLSPKTAARRARSKMPAPVRSNSAFAVSSSQTSRPSGRLKRKVTV